MLKWTSKPTVSIASLLWLDFSLGLLIDGNNKKTGLAESVPEVRQNAAHGLQENFDVTAIPALADHVQKDPDDQVRVACARALKNAKTPEALRALITAMEDATPPSSTTPAKPSSPTPAKTWATTPKPG